MSYCRFSNTSDVYVFANVAGICICTAGDESGGANQRREFIVAGPMQALTILEKLKQEGFRVPRAAIKRLQLEARS